jgi:hypothetical protein
MSRIDLVAMVASSTPAETDDEPLTITVAKHALIKAYQDRYIEPEPHTVLRINPDGSTALESENAPRGDRIELKPELFIESDDTDIEAILETGPTDTARREWHLAVELTESIDSKYTPGGTGRFEIEYEYPYECPSCGTDMTPAGGNYHCDDCEHPRNQINNPYPDTARY